MHITRRQGLLALAAAALGGRAAAQQDYPTRPIKLLIPFSPGGSPDLLGRLIGQQVGRQLGQTVVAENRLGANGIIAADAVAKAAPDGYTLLLTTGSQAINPSIYKKLPYDSAADFAPVSLLTVAPALTLVVNVNSPLRTVQDFLAAARKPDSKLSFGSPGIGNTLHLAGELLNDVAGTRLLHVPYKGAAPALQAVMGGEVTACFLSTTAAIIAVKAGQVRPLAVTSAQRIAPFPEVPTLAESGLPGFDYNGGWVAVFAPGKTPPAIVRRLSAEFDKAMQVSEIREQMIKWDSQPIGGTPEDLGRFVQAETHRFARIVKQAGIEPQ
ncbi:MAG: tripartite tricarboxylate transporter substrate binding protein [Rubrivivax sp.]